MKIGVTAGAFDLLHPGHVSFLQSCKKRCDNLIVLLQVNPNVDRPDKHKPIETIYERYVRLSSCAPVNEIIPYETEKDLTNILVTRKFDIRFLGSEYKDRDYTGKGIIEEYLIPREHYYSSTSLRERIKNA